MGMILESTTKDLNAIQEQLRDTEKAIDVIKAEVCSIPEGDYVTFIRIIYTFLFSSFKFWETNSMLGFSSNLSHNFLLKWI
jgi:hypothetical protein